jgi:hypothetical protein
MSQLKIILSVDWEPDHGPWRWRGADIDYGGILKGTPAFCSLLDELRIPCTWFIECSHEPKRDLPDCLPEVVRQIVDRQQDEVGLHVHWRRQVSDNSVIYDTSDTAWVSAQIDHGVRQLESVGARPCSFRSGALLHIPELPLILAARGFLVDSSILWDKGNRLQADRNHLIPKRLRARVGALMQRLLGPLPDPYSSDEYDIERRGGSVIVEFPISYSLFDSRTLIHGALASFLRHKALRAAGRAQYLMLFFHIDELTKPMTGPDTQTELDLGMLRHFKDHLTVLQSNGAQFLTCSAARNHWVRNGAAEAHLQTLVD